MKKAIVRLYTPIHAHKREDCQEANFTLFRFIRVQECTELLACIIGRFHIYGSNLKFQYMNVILQLGFILLTIDILLQ